MTYLDEVVIVQLYIDESIRPANNLSIRPFAYLMHLRTDRRLSHESYSACCDSW